MMQTLDSGCRDSDYQRGWGGGDQTGGKLGTLVESLESWDVGELHSYRARVETLTHA